jgi:DNA-binding protein HU-beta
MNRAELITEIAELTGQTKTQVTDNLNAIIWNITNTLSKGDKVTLVGFGTFEKRKRQARTGRNPRTLAPLRIPASNVPAFRAGQELKDVENGRSRQKSFDMPSTSSSSSSKKSSSGSSKKSSKKRR